jgi:ribosomal-protein-alanine N-acetyltransferase
MAFFRTVAFAETLPSIDGQGVTLRLPQMAEFEEWAALRTASRDFLTPWEPSWPADDLTRAAFRRRLKRYAEDWRTDQSYAFFIFRKQDNVLLGGLTLANVRRGVALLFRDAAAAPCGGGLHPDQYGFDSPARAVRFSA